MAEVEVQVANSSAKASRRSFTREFKLSVIQWFHSHIKNILQTASYFKIDQKQVRQWVRNEEKVRKQKRKSKGVRGRKAMYALLEEKLFEEFSERRSHGKIVKKLSSLIDGLLDFADAKISSTQNSRVAKVAFVTKGFCREISCKLCDIANMDQTPLPFVLEDGTTYDEKGSKKSGSQAVNRNKRQCTVQLTIFGDGIPRVWLTVIFRGKGKRIRPNQKKSWDKRIKVYFQPKAWCDESIMKQWVCDEWGNIFTNLSTSGSSGKILVADVHTAQQRDEVKRLVVTKKTVLVNVLPGCTGRVQPLDVSVNKPFKNYVREQFERHLDENLDLFVEGKLAASERRVLTTKWVGNAWEKLSENKGMSIRSYVKCGITRHVDGSEDD